MKKKIIRKKIVKPTDNKSATLKKKKKRVTRNKKKIGVSEMPKGMEIGELPKEVVRETKTKLEEFLEVHNVSTTVRDLAEQYEKLPPLEWFSDELLMEAEWREYRKDLGININGNSKEYFLDFMYDCIILLSGDEDLIRENYTLEQIRTMVNYLLIGDFDELDYNELFDKLSNEYMLNLTLASMSLFPRGGLEDDFEPVPEAIERLDKVEAIGYDLVPMTTDEVNEAGFFDEMDEELERQIFEEKGYLAVRDSKGRFIKGQKKVRRRKDVYGTQLPKMACNSCNLAGTCPKYRPHSTCAYDDVFHQFSTRSPEDMEDLLYSLGDEATARVMKALMAERLNGGVPNASTMREIENTLNIIQRTQDMRQVNSEIVARQVRTINADGSSETVSTIKQGGGFLEKLLKSTLEDDE